jgi:hypothetical protein
MQKRLICLIVCLLAACGNSESKTPDPLVDGRRLESKSLNFRIEAPEGFTWRVEPPMAETHLFVAENGNTKVRLLIQGRNYDETTEDRAYQYVNGMRRSYEKRGMTVEDVLVSRHSSKLGNGYRYFFRAVRGGGAARVDGYLVANDRLYNLEHTGTTSDDVLSPFIASLAPAP